MNTKQVHFTYFQVLRFNSEAVTNTQMEDLRQEMLLTMKMEIDKAREEEAAKVKQEFAAVRERLDDVGLQE
jgi:acyl-CoA thioesterase FadM